MADGFVLPPGAGHRIGGAGMTLKVGAQQSGKWSAFEAEVAPGFDVGAHRHAEAEEIFYILAGRGISWQAGSTAEVRTGDCIVYQAGHGAHTLHAREPLDVLAFGTRHSDEALGFPRLGLSRVGRRAVESAPGALDGVPIQLVRESELGPPELPEPPGERPATIVNLDQVERSHFGRGGVSAQRRNLGRAAGSQRTGLKHSRSSPVGAPPQRTATRWRRRFS